jgi:hypothetical protein
MKRFHGTQTVDPGLYFNVRRLSFRSVEEASRLPGRSDEVYRRVPALALLVVGPFLGLVYVLFLPFIGLAMVSWLLARKAGQIAHESGGAIARVLAPAWKPATAFLSRSKRGKKRSAKRDRWAEKTRKKLDKHESGR